MLFTRFLCSLFSFLLKGHQVDEVEETDFLAFEELLLFLILLLLDLLFRHIVSTYELFCKVFVNLAHLLGSRIELEGNDPGAPLRCSPIDKLSNASDDDIINAVVVCGFL